MRKVKHEGKSSGTSPRINTAVAAYSNEHFRVSKSDWLLKDSTIDVILSNLHTHFIFCLMNLSFLVLSRAYIISESFGQRVTDEIDRLSDWKKKKSHRDLSSTRAEGRKDEKSTFTY